MPGLPATEATQQIETLILAVEDLRRRVAALERSSRSELPTSTPELPSFAGQPQPLSDISSGLVASLGQLLVGIGGAYLLRAITEAHWLPERAGTLAGLAYAGAWLIASLRIAATRRMAALVAVLTSLAIVIPLVWEATFRFHTLSRWEAAATLAVVVVLGQAVGWRRDDSAIAGVTSLAGSIAALAFTVATLDPVPFTAALVIAAGMVEYGAFRDRGLAWRWSMAVASDASAMLVIYIGTRAGGPPEGYGPMPLAAVVAIPIALALVYVTSVGARTLVRGLRLAWLEIVQVVAVAALAMAVGMRTSAGGGFGVLATGGAAIAIGAASYIAAFSDRARGHARNFHIYASLALLLVLAGSALLLSGAGLTVLCALMALGAIWLGWRQRGSTLAMHAAIYLLVAATASGLLILSTGTLVSPAYRLSLTPAWILTLLVTALVYGLSLRVPMRQPTAGSESVRRAIPAALLCWGVVGLAAGILIRAGLRGPLLNTARTALISGTVLALAWLGRRWNLPELIWMLFPWAAFGAVKLVVEDFAAGSPATLFVSLVLYGGMLVALPRLLRRTEG
jgi:hypothetical protein